MSQIDDAKFLLNRPEVTAALKTLSTSSLNFVWARDFVTTALGGIAVTPTPTPTPIPVPVPAPVGIPIANQAALVNALAIAKGGEILALADGNYTVVLTDKTYALPVVISGGRGACITWTKLTRAKKVTFTGVTLAGKAGLLDGQTQHLLDAAEDILFDNIALVGPDKTGFGLFLRTSGNKNITIQNSYISGFHDGIEAWGGSEITIKKNVFRGMGSDCIQFSNVHGIYIDYNDFDGTSPVTGAHPDIIQMVDPSSNIYIRHNKLRGKSMGISSHDSTKRMTNLFVEDNDVWMTGYANSIRVLNAVGSAKRNKITSPSATIKAIFLTGGMSREGNTLDGQSV